MIACASNARVADRAIALMQPCRVPQSGTPSPIRCNATLVLAASCLPVRVHRQVNAQHAAVVG